MRLSNQKLSHSTRIELSTTSMIDVVFLLLIYFLVVATFQIPEKQLQSNIKTEKPSTAVQQLQLEPAIVDVFRAGEEDYYRIGGVTTNQLDALAEVLESFPNKSDGAFVRVADDVKFESGMLAINQCRTAGFLIVTYVPGDPATDIDGQE